MKLITLSEGEVGELHVGLKGTMNVLFSKDLAQKTRRSLEGRIRQGKLGGGLCFGYDIVRGIDAAGEPVQGVRRINEIEAAIVRRIFEEFGNGRSPRAIAGALNNEAIPGPASKYWGPSTVYGNWRRGTGILNNELYTGRLVWNRQRFIKDQSSPLRLLHCAQQGDLPQPVDPAARRSGSQGPGWIPATIDASRNGHDIHSRVSQGIESASGRT